MPCESWIPLIDAACDGDLTPADRVRLEEHAAGCASCADEWRGLDAVGREMRIEMPAAAASEGLAKRVQWLVRDAIVEPPVAAPLDTANDARWPRSGRTDSPARATGRSWAVAAAAMLAVIGTAQFASRPAVPPSPVRGPTGREATGPLPPGPGLVRGDDRTPGPGGAPSPSGIGATGIRSDDSASPAAGIPENRPAAAPRDIELAFSEYSSAASDEARRALIPRVLSDRFEAVPYLLSLLASPGPERRRHAIVLLAEARDPRASRALARVLDDPLLAPAALQALGAIADPIARAVCIRALRRESLREAALAALALRPDPSLVEPLAQAAGEGAVSPAAAARLIRPLPPAEARRPLYSALRSAEERMRDAAVAILVECGDSAVRPGLESAFAERTTRSWAAGALARLKDPACVEAIVVAARDPAAEEEVLHVLHAIGAPAVKACRELLARPDRSLQRRTVRLLGRLGNASATPILVEAARDPELRFEAVAALARCGDGRAAPLFLSVVSDRRLAPEAIAALGAMKETSAIPVLIPALRRREVRDGALDALRRITEEDFGLDAAQWTRWWKAREAEERGKRPGVVAVCLETKTIRGVVPSVLERSRS
ncbi:MAG: HEAT repeat domain-containing protein [Planctomycetes bacterium]|nr:HEAT repeat domain-containing protein [Planctomycetota bacterium]